MAGMDPIAYGTAQLNLVFNLILMQERCPTDFTARLGN